MGQKFQIKQGTTRLQMDERARSLSVYPHSVRRVELGRNGRLTND